MYFLITEWNDLIAGLSSADSETHSSAGGLFLSAENCQQATSRGILAGGKENKNCFDSVTWITGAQPVCGEENN